MPAQNKEAYFEGLGIDPALVELYHERLGDVDRVLDVGCGTGSIGRHLPDTVEVVGVDIDRGALERAKGHERPLLSDLESESLPFADDTFDGIIAKDVLEHLVRPSPIVQELYRVLKPGNRLVVSVPMAKKHVVWGDYTHIRGFTEGALETMLRDYGFDVVDITPMGGFSGAGRFGLVKQLPWLLSVPPLRRFAVSHEGVFEKPR
ncbi:class I SAM-dependent methyltransferase [Halomicrobium katesii]|uniref:class I SAM-dependent methyltransferase n=1 Tax=Halomicrobium katesii TaxID=437163 RepID=UPI0003693AFB|nr:class I SAM-dependent methyltransferase [Halomicrobium katesii]